MGFSQQKYGVINYYGTQIQSAVQALPIAIVYGAPRVPGNIVYANGFNRVQVNTSGGKGGKGLLTGGKNTSQQSLYYATLVIAICEGPIGNIIAMYYDSNISFNLALSEVDPNSQVGKSGQPNDIPVNATFFPGGPDQEPWTYVEGLWPADARGYKDTCYVGLPNMQLDSTATPPQINFVPLGAFAGTCPLFPSTYTGSYQNNDGQFFVSYAAGLVDADPALCINDFLTNPRYGAGFPADLIDPSIFSTTSSSIPAVGDGTLQTYCQAIGFGWSEYINSAESASSIIDRWTKNMAVAVVWTGATLKFIPYWDEPNASNPGYTWPNPTGVLQKYFVPIVDPIIAFTDDHFLQSKNPEEEPVTLERSDPSDVYNYVRVSFRDQSNQFNDNIEQDSDEVAIELYGPRIDNAQVAHEFSHGGYAQASATVQLRRNMSIRRKVTFRLPPDVIEVTSGPLVNMTFRIVSIDEDEESALTIVAEEFPAGAGAPTIFPAPVTTATTTFQTNVPAHSINVPAIFEPTAQMLAAAGTASPTIVIGASSAISGVADPNWGGCEIYASAASNGVYTQIGTINGPSRQGTLTANLAAYTGANPDGTNTLSVTLLESGGQLSSTTATIAAGGATLCAIIDASGCIELLSFTTATLTGPNAYNLTGLYRGLYGTQGLAHLSGAQFLRVDSSVANITLPPQLVGETVYLKMTSFNNYNAGVQSLSDPNIVTYTYSPTGAGVGPSNNAVLAGLLAGNPENWGALGSPVLPGLNLNSGGSAACSPFLYNIHLGTL
jgi:hypothetical protein